MIRLTSFLAAVAIAAPALADTLTGHVSYVRDGDTIEIGDTAIRLKGVSAPELDEPLGHAAKDFMTALVLGKSILCEMTGAKTYDRLVGTCYLDGEDIGAIIIEAGLALDCPRYSGGRYSSLEQAEAVAAISLPRYCD